MGICLAFIDVYPDKAQYHPGEEGNIIVEVEATSACRLKIQTAFSELSSIFSKTEKEIVLVESRRDKVLIPFQAEGVGWKCIGVDVNIYLSDELQITKSTAFDIADHWRRAPRYGFLSDFPKEELGDTNDVISLSKYHINIVQFYDWMYRHDELVPPTHQFVDPMGRQLSYDVITEKKHAVQEKGMGAIAYGAVYASLKDYFEEHKNLALYKRNGEPFNLIDRFYIMDISPYSAWTEKIISELVKVIKEGFDGVHLDQYGFPKKGIRNIDHQAEVVDLAPCYKELIDRLKKEIHVINDQAGLIFNNVSNYPVATTAKANQECVYIEVWPPVKHLFELKQLVCRARELSGKQVILSAYLPAFRELPVEQTDEAENGALLTMATIFACGGYHLLLGEGNSVLTAAYYPNYVRMRDSFIQEVRHYYDFIVRYGKLLYSSNLYDVSMTYTGGVNTEVQFTSEHKIEPNGDLNTIWSIVKNSSQFMVIHLINLIGLEDDIWEKGKKTRPREQQNIICTVLMEYQIEELFIASPEQNDGRPVTIEYEEVDHEQGKAIRFTIPLLKIWDMIVINWK
ncbi:hypothetical protein J9303_05805 [Bacillaceae bacterium Marseille-Q3522]|nr:hypothetical protein [Bacillaceae bacterium Marseille-Q3522]